jgi:hypothetical protein
MIESIPSSPERTGSYVRETPPFAAQVADDTRTNKITTLSETHYLHSNVPDWHDPDITRVHVDKGAMSTATEHDLLEELDTFLAQAPPSWIERAHFWEEPEAILTTDLRENLTFVGASEYDEAAEYLVGELRGLLLAGKQVCIPAGIAGSHYTDKGLAKYKSDTYLLDNLIGRFTADERATYVDQLVVNVADITASGDDLRVWLLDDLTLTGSVLGRASREFATDYPQYLSSTEARVIVAPKALIRSGFAVPIREGMSLWQGGHMPIHAYFGAHEVPEGRARTSNGAFIATALAAPAVGFGEMVAGLAKNAGVNAPGLVNPQRPYRVHNYKPENLLRYREEQQAARLRTRNGAD